MKMKSFKQFISESKTREVPIKKLRVEVDSGGWGVVHVVPENVPIERAKGATEETTVTFYRKVSAADIQSAVAQISERGLKTAVIGYRFDDEHLDSLEMEELAKYNVALHDSLKKSGADVIAVEVI